MKNISPDDGTNLKKLDSVDYMQDVVRERITKVLNTPTQVTIETFRQYNNEVTRTIPDLTLADLIANFALGIGGEAGEIFEVLKKHVYHKNDPELHEKIIKELGDLLWYLTALGQQFGFTLDQIACYNVAKLRDRHPEGFTSNYDSSVDVSSRVESEVMEGELEEIKVNRPQSICHDCPGGKCECNPYSS